jgi:hypothetical protein
VPVGDSLVEAGLGGVEQGLLQPLDRLALRSRDLGERLPAFELVRKFLFRQPQVRGRTFERVGQWFWRKRTAAVDRADRARNGVGKEVNP